MGLEEGNAAMVCDPIIENCGAEDPWRNTIELDYKTPNTIVGLISIVNFLVPFIAYRFVYLKEIEDQTMAALYADNKFYGWAWWFARTASNSIWGLSSLAWIISRLIGPEVNVVALFLFAWWGSFMTVSVPILGIVTLATSVRGA